MTARFKPDHPTHNPLTRIDPMTRDFTEAAQRVLQTATRLVAGRHRETVQPDHLFQALLLEEGRASEVLVNHGFAPDASALEHRSPPGEQDTQGHDSPAPSPQLESLLQDARHLSGPAGRNGEIGTEHLLWGLTRVASPISRTLLERGIDERLLEDLFGDVLPVDREPIDVDLSNADLLPTITKDARPVQAEPPTVWRILDAAANRAREGLRVIEDYARFCLDDRALTAEIKHCRHRLSYTVDSLGSEQLLDSRDTAHDVGTTVTTQTETERNSVHDVLKANLKRVQESVRTLEEYSKLLDTRASVVFEQTRYQMYALEQRILAFEDDCHPLAKHRLYLLLTEAACQAEWSRVANQALEAGVRLIQLREKTKSDRQLIEIGRQLRDQTLEHGALLIVNDRPDVAVAIKADGVHVGQDELRVADARSIVGPQRLVGVSTHSLEQATAAVEQGADYLGVGPVFPSTTKDFTDFVGLDLVATVSKNIEIPWYAIGGISATNLADVLDAGAPGAAVTAAICGAQDVGRATQELLALFDPA
ncbi:MAG: thiamine phosphate synthase [Planctomycetaceae bacterium]